MELEQYCRQRELPEDQSGRISLSFNKKVVYKNDYDKNKKIKTISKTFKKFFLFLAFMRIVPKKPTLLASAVFYSKLESLGFKYSEREKMKDEMTRAGWSKLELTMEKEGKTPEIRLWVSVHPMHGVHIALLSEPPDERYHFSTGDPVNHEEAFELVERYLLAIRKGT